MLGGQGRKWRQLFEGDAYVILPLHDAGAPFFDVNQYLINRFS